jgi:hypothetical protein
MCFANSCASAAEADSNNKCGINTSTSHDSEQTNNDERNVAEQCRREKEENKSSSSNEKW